MPTMPCGSGTGCRASVWSASWPTGKQHAWPAPPPCWNCPTDRPRPAQQGYARRPAGRLAWTPDLSAQPASLEPAARRDPVHDPAGRLGQVLLHRYSGQDDIVIGTPVGHRRRAEIEALIGFFVNTLALRMDLSGSSRRFADLLGRVREAALEPMAHQDLPFETAGRELAAAAQPEHAPLFQVMFVLQNTPAESGSARPQLASEQRYAQRHLEVRPDAWR